MIEQQMIDKQKLLNLRGKYIKQTLVQLEQINGGRIKPEERKAILDGFNDLMRDVLLHVGFLEEIQQ